MKRIIWLLMCAFVLSVNVLAHQAFTLVSSEHKIIKSNDLTEIEKSRTIGAKDGANLTFTNKEIRLVVATGPEDDMLSYRIQGVRNPNLIVPSGAVLKVLFVNSDEDMKHDVRFGHVTKDFEIAPDIAETVGSERLEHTNEDGAMQAEEFVIKPTGEGAYKYFCSVRGHAKGGMWGNIFVGVKPGDAVKMPEKMTHVHSADEEKDENHPPDEMKMEMPDKPAKKPDDEMSGMQPDDKKPDEMSGMKMDDKKSDSMAGMNHGEHDSMANMPGMNHGAMAMRSVVNINDPMARESSGTAWSADSAPMYAWMKTFGDGGMLMLHASFFVRYTAIGSSRDAKVGGKGSRSRFDAPSMLMAMYSRPLTNKTQIGFRVMTSLDPVIERGYGYPLLYQSGETYGGEPLHDRQHPHDLFSELAVTLSHKFDEKQSVYFYAGYPGEPALGPPTFMHRLSGMDNPDAPIGHHWQDATHITFGVVTAGYTYDKFKFEASAFKGREPDENRWNFDKPKLDSFSGRFSYNPTKEWSFQISHGYLKNPEPAEPEVKIRRRTTASAIYNKNLTNDRNWSNAFVWGRNKDDEGGTNAFLYESNYQFQKNTIFGRAEQVQKSAHELVLEDAIYQNRNYLVGAFSVGYIRDIVKDKGIDVGLGAMATYNHNPASLTPVYGGTNHGGLQIFMRFRPSRMKH